MMRWPGKVPAGKVENGIISGLDWFPTFVAAAGNPNIVEELKKGKKLGDTTYKVHLDGYNQMDMITGKGPSKRHEIFYFGGEHARRGAHRRLQVSLHRPARRLARRQGPSPTCPILTNLRLDPFERTGLAGNGTRWIAGVLRLVQVRVLALRVRPAGSGEAGHDGHRVPADAEGRELQPRCRESEDRGSHEEAGAVGRTSEPRNKWGRTRHRGGCGSFDGNPAAEDVTRECLRRTEDRDSARSVARLRSGARRGPGPWRRHADEGVAGDAGVHQARGARARLQPARRRLVCAGVVDARRDDEPLRGRAGGS